MSGIIQINGKIIVDGIEIPPCPSKSKCYNSTIIGNKIYMNGYEFKDGKWVRSLKALWHLFV